MGNKNSTSSNSTSSKDISSESRLIIWVTNAYNDNIPLEDSFYRGCPTNKKNFDKIIKMKPGYIIASYKPKHAYYGNWAHTGILYNFICITDDSYKKKLRDKFNKDDYFPDDRFIFRINHAAYPKTISTTTFLRPIGEIRSIKEKEIILQIRDMDGKNYYENFPPLKNTITIRALSLKENDSIGLTNEKIKRIENAVCSLSEYFKREELKYGGICKLVSRCSEILPRDLNKLVTEQLKKMENIQDAELICSSFALLTYQLVLFITNNIDILEKVLPFNAEACLPRNIANLHKTLPEYWKASTYIFGCDSDDLISFGT
jgi:hypothetical protein